MSRATIQEIDEFDDEFDLPLPSRPLPSFASQGGSTFPPRGVPMAAQAQSARPELFEGVNPGVHVTTDATPFKTWTCVYPIYIDAKRPYGAGRRRVAREKSCWWPQSQQIAEAAAKLRFPCFHEPDKTHPRDWENPGRVKILFKENGRFTNNQVQTKKQLLEALSIQIQNSHRSQAPTPEQLVAKPPRQEHSQPVADGVPQEPTSKKGKASAIPPAPAKVPSPRPLRSKRAPHVPSPPEPLPSVTDRFGVRSPLVEAGILVETVKVAINQQMEEAKKEKEKEKQAASSATAGKPKKKVMRVRG